MIKWHEIASTDAFCIITGDLNQAGLMKYLPNFHQHITFNTRGRNTLGHCCTAICNAHHSNPHLHFGKSNHLRVLFVPAHRQRLKSVVPVNRTKKCWSELTEEWLLDCFKSVDWAIFKDIFKNCDAVFQLVGFLAFCPFS